MGLDISHDAFSGAYSAFNRFRGFIAKGTGGSFPPHDDESLDRNCWYFGEGYNKTKHPGLWELLCHSDCDGKITPGKCNKLANELEELMPKLLELAENDDGGGHISRDGGYIEVTKRFIAGCRLAAERKESLRFR
jgi:hypothetical protein